MNHKQRTNDPVYMFGLALGRALSDPESYKKLQEMAQDRGATIEELVQKKLKSFEHTIGKPKAQGLLTGKELNYPEFTDKMEYNPGMESKGGMVGRVKKGPQMQKILSPKRANREGGRI